MENVVAPPFTGLTGVTVIWGVMLSDQLSSMPVAAVPEFTSLSVHVPGIHMPGSRTLARSTWCPVKAESELAGWNAPVNGAVPELIELSAESSMTVLTKFAPVPPTPENNVTSVPSGAIKIAVRFESGENAALSSRVMSATVNVPSKLGMVNVEVSMPGVVAFVAEGINCPVLLVDG
jgi:hypothetical protein